MLTSAILRKVFVGRSAIFELGPKLKPEFLMKIWVSFKHLYALTLR